MKIDKNEKKLCNKKKFEYVNDILKQEFPDLEIGQSEYMWARKKELLKQLYNIDWKSPKELNPTIIFD